MCNATFNRILGGRQCLTKDLTAKHLGSTDIAAVTAKNIVLDALQAKQTDQIFQYRMHKD